MPTYLILALLLCFPSWGAFDGTPSQLLDRAKASKLDPDSQVIVLDEHARMRFDAQGRRTLTYHRIYFLRHQDAVEDNSTLSVSFTPWYQSRPAIKARVITPDQNVHWLDATTLVDSPALEYEKDIYSDRRTVSAPLPAVAAGSVVEYEYTLVGTAPFFPAGTVEQWQIGESLTIGKLSFEITAPTSLALTVLPVLLADNALVKTQSGPDTRWRLALEPAPKFLRRLPLLPNDVPRYPYVGITTGRTWSAVARAYSALVEDKVAGADVSSLTTGLNPASPRDQLIDTILRRIHQQVRYVGIELGDGAIVPRAPKDVLTRHYGDCKDKSTLLVAALRKLGIPAHVALLSSGFGQDVHPDLPGMGDFNHAIAYVPGPNPLWIDATSEHHRLGDLPLADQGRYALVAAPGTESLLRIPVAPMDANVDRYQREVFLSDSGKTRLVEVIEARGADEATLRSIYAGEPSKSMRDALKNYAKSALLSEEQTLLSNPALHDFSRPFQLKWQSPHSGRFVVERSSGVAVLITGLLFNNIPESLRTAPEAGSDDKDPDTVEWKQRIAARTLPLELTMPYRSELDYTIHLPPNFRLKSLPKSTTEDYGPARLTSTYKTTPAGTIHASFRFELPRRTLTPAEANALRDRVVAHLKSRPVVLDLVHTAEEKIALGQIKEALEDLRRARDKEPALPLHHQRLARAYLTAGLGTLARASARKAVDLAPTSADVYRDLAFVLQHDEFGQHFRTGWDRPGVIAALEKSLSLEQNPVATVDLAITYEHSKDGLRYSSKPDLLQAIALYGKLGDKLQSSGAEQNYAIALMNAGEWEAMRTAAGRLSNQALGRLLAYVGQACIEGAASTILSIQRDFADTSQRVNVLATVAATLNQVRQYELGTELFKAAARISPSADLNARVDVSTKLKRLDLIESDPSIPDTVARRFFALLFSSDAKLEAFRDLFYDTREFDRDVVRMTRRDEDPLGELREVSAPLLRQWRKQGITPQVGLEILFSKFSVSHKGDESNGYLIEASIDGNPQPGSFIAWKRDNSYKLVGIDSEPASMRNLMLELLEQNRLAPVQTWLDWMIAANKSDAPDNELTLPVFRYLWSSPNPRQRDAVAARTAVASISTLDEEVAPRMIPILEASLNKARSARDKAHILYAIARHYKAADNAPAFLASTRKLVDLVPRSIHALELHAEALLLNQLPAELETLLSKATRSGLDTRPSQVLLALHRKDYKSAARLQDQIATGDAASLDSRIRALWLRLLAGDSSKPPFEIKEEASNSAADSKRIDISLARALADLNADRPTEALQRIQQVLAESSADLRHPALSLVYSRLASSFGEPAESLRFAAAIRARRTAAASLSDPYAVLLKP